jgi:hypothetical protein
VWLLYLRFDDRGQVKTYHIRTYSKATVDDLMARAERHGLTSTAQLVEHAAFIANSAIRPKSVPNFHFFLHEEFIKRWMAVEGPAVMAEDASQVVPPPQIESLAGCDGISLDEDAINEQRTLLAIHRRTLAHYLARQGILTTAHTPPEITHGIAEARANIARVKAILHASGVQVAEYPDDVAPDT